jgi:glutaryl-CoA dehydrogenase
MFRKLFPTLTRFNKSDPLGTFLHLNEEQKLISDTVKQFAQTELVPKIRNDFQYEKFERSAIKKMGNLGLLGCNHMDKVSYGLVSRQLEKVDSSYRSMCSVQSSLVMLPIQLYGSQQQKEKYLPLLERGDYIGCFGLTEPDAGSDPKSMKTMTMKSGESKYIVNGSKNWISNSPVADIFIVWTRLNSEIRGIILERSMTGLTTPTISNKASMRASKTGMIVMDNVEITEENILPLIKGLPLIPLNLARYSISWGVLGAAEDCLEKTLAYALERKQFGSSIASNQIVQQKFADMYTELALGYQGCLQVGRLLDNDHFTPDMISLLKRNNCQKALNIARECRDILGGNGISYDYDIIRHLLNLEAVNTYEGTNTIHTLILGKAITGIQAFTHS